MKRLKTQHFSSSIYRSSSEYLQQSANSHLIYFPVIQNNTSSVLFFFLMAALFNLQYDWKSVL